MKINKDDLNGHILESRIAGEVEKHSAAPKEKSLILQSLFKKGTVENNFIVRSNFAKGEHKYSTAFNKLEEAIQLYNRL